MKAAPELRPMRRDDLPRVEAIYRQHAPDVADSEWLPVASEAIADERGAPLAWVAVTTVAKKARVVGYVVGEIRSWEFGSAPAGWVIGIGVDLEHLATGAGQKLMDKLVESFVARGTRTVRTMVRRDDVKVLRFFRNVGFATGPYTELEMEVQP